MCKNAICAGKPSLKKGKNLTMKHKMPLKVQCFARKKLGKKYQPILLLKL